MYEPRGHADMYGCHVVPPNDDGADLGVVFFHNAGYSTACGHGTIALVTWALDEGVVERREGENRVVVDVPSGRLETWATVEDGRVRSVRFRNVPSFVWATGSRLPARSSTSPSAAPSTHPLEERVDARRAAAADRARPCDQGARSKRSTMSSIRSSPSCATSTASSSGSRRAGDPLTQRNVTVFADGEVDRSPCGTGTSARLALLDASGQLPRGEAAPPARSSAPSSPGRVVGDADVAGIAGCGHRGRRARAYRTGLRTFELDPDDPLGEGFLLR